MEPDLVASGGLPIEFKSARLQLSSDLPVPKS